MKKSNGSKPAASMTLAKKIDVFTQVPAWSEAGGFGAFRRQFFDDADTSTPHLIDKLVVEDGPHPGFDRSATGPPAIAPRFPCLDHTCKRRLEYLPSQVVGIARSACEDARIGKQRAFHRWRIIAQGQMIERLVVALVVEEQQLLIGHRGVIQCRPSVVGRTAALLTGRGSWP